LEIVYADNDGTAKYANSESDPGSCRNKIKCDCHTRVVPVN
jgi:hypothetical protein